MNMDVATILAWLSVVVIILGFIKIIANQATEKENKKNAIQNLKDKHDDDFKALHDQIEEEHIEREKENIQMSALFDKMSQRFEVVITRLADISIIDANQKASERRITAFEQAQEKINDKMDAMNEVINKIWVNLESKANREDR